MTCYDICSWELVLWLTHYPLVQYLNNSNNHLFCRSRSAGGWVRCHEWRRCWPLLVTQYSDTWHCGNSTFGKDSQYKTRATENFNFWVLSREGLEMVSVAFSTPIILSPRIRDDQHGTSLKQWPIPIYNWLTALAPVHLTLRHLIISPGNIPHIKTPHASTF